MASLSDHQRQKLIQEVFHCFQKSLGVIVDGRQSPQPTEDSTNRPVGYVENSKYIGVVTRVAELDPFIPICLEIFYSDASRNNMVRLEKWLFSYMKEGGGFQASMHPGVNAGVGSSTPTNARRIGLLMRTLYCFARLLPAFYISTSSSVQLFYRISYNDVTADSHISSRSPSHISSRSPAIDGSYDANVLSYQFPPVSLPVGSIAMSVVYMDPNTLQSVAGPAMAPVRALQPSNQLQRPITHHQQPPQGQGQGQRQGQFASQQRPARRHSMGTDQGNPHSVPVTIPPELQQQYQRQQQQQNMSQSQSNSSAGRSCAIPICAGSSPPITIPGTGASPQQFGRTGSGGSGGGGSGGGGINYAGHASSLPTQQQQTQSRSRGHSGSSPATSDQGSLQASGSIGSSQQYMRPPIGPSSYTNQSQLPGARRSSRAESFDETQGNYGAGAFCLPNGNSPSSVPPGQSELGNSMQQPLVSYWIAGSSPSTGGGINANATANRNIGFAQAGGGPTNNAGPGSQKGQTMSLGQSVPQASPPYMQCSPTLVALTGPGAAAQAQCALAPPLRSYSGPSAPLVGTAYLTPMLQTLLQKTDAILSLNVEPTFVKFPVAAGNTNPFEVMLMPLQRSPFDHKSQRAERDRERDRETEKERQDSQGSGGAAMISGSSGSMHSGVGSFGATADGARASFGRPMDVIREYDKTDGADSTDSDSDSSEEDMPFAWVPDAAVERSPPKNSRKETSPLDKRPGMDDFSPMNFPTGMGLPTAVGMVENSSAPTGSIQKQCANPPTLSSFSERELIPGHMSSGMPARRGLLADRKAILDAINANYTIIVNQIANYD